MRVFLAKKRMVFETRDGIFEQELGMALIVSLTTRSISLLGLRTSSVSVQVTYLRRERTKKKFCPAIAFFVEVSLTPNLAEGRIQVKNVFVRAFVVDERSTKVA